MANEKNDISDIVKTCKILLLDIEGTTTSISFVKDKLFPYVEENVKGFLDNEWESDDVKEAVTALRKLALEDEENKVDGAVTIPGEDASKEDQIDGLVKNVKWQMSLDRKVGPLKQLQGLIWSKGYDKGDIKGHVYDDVSPALELWRSVDGQKVYIYSSGSVQAQKLLFGMSSAGDMLKLIDGHFDTAVGAKQEASSYTNIAEKIGCKTEEILFLTDIDKEAEAARSAGVQVALVSREGNAPLAEVIATSYPVLYSFAELAVTKKRKPVEQDEQQPAKVPKTDVETNVKTSTETQIKDSPQPIATTPEEKHEEIEKMDVEEVVPTSEEGPVKEEKPAKEETPAKDKSPVKEEAPAKADARGKEDKPAKEEASAKEETSAKAPKEVVEKIETIVEEITDLNEIKDIPVSDIKPIIIESNEKTDQKEIESMETEPAEIESSVSAAKENGDKDEPVPEETPPVVITEIQDITNDKESLSKVTEMIEDIVPVVEEPPAHDMEDLQNVGEVLAKECDEILSKVQDVTNLDNIPLKPLLNPIAEETMETDNMDTNDIVEGILDKEQELEMEKNSVKDINTVQEKSESETVTDEAKCEKQDIPNNPEIIEREEKHENAAVEATIVEETKESETKIPANSVTEMKEEVSSLTTEDKAKENILTTEEMVKENSLQAEKMVKENVLKTEEIAKHGNQTEEKMQESCSSEVNREENSVIDKKEEISITEEKVTESSTTKEMVEECSITEEKINESTVTEKVEECQPEAKNEKKDVLIVDEVKSKIDEEKNDTEMETDTPQTEVSNVIPEEKKTETVEKSEVDGNKIVDDEVDGNKVAVDKLEDESTELPTEISTEKPAVNLKEESSMEVNQPEVSVDMKEIEKVSTDSAVGEVQQENDSKETQINGKAANGDADMVNLNGDASKEDEVSSRLSMENGKDVVNGANGDSNDAEVKCENKGDDIKEVADIKVKTVAMEESHNDPIEQPTEA